MGMLKKNVLGLAAQDGAVLKQYEGFVGWFLGSMESTFDRHGVEASPLLVMLVEDTLSHGILVRQVIAEVSTHVGDKNKDVRAYVVLVDLLLKVRERMRKSVMDLMSGCADAGTPIAKGLCEEYGVVAESMAGLLEAATAYRADHPVNDEDVLGGPLQDQRPDQQAVAASGPDDALAEANASGDERNEA